MLWASLALVLGAVAWVGMSLGSTRPELVFGYEQVIHARIPWLLLGTLWLGVALGGLALVRGRRWYHYSLVGAELLLVGGLTFYFVEASFLPKRDLRVAVGDAFPAYALVDQDEGLHRRESGEVRAPALYVFYRGDW